MSLMTKSRSYLSFFVVMCLTQELAAFAALLVQGVVLADKGSFVKGTVKSADATGIIVTLADQVEGTVDISEVSEDKVDDASAIVKVGDEIEVKILNVDAKEKTIQLSLKAKNATKPKAAKKKVEAEESSDNAGTTNLGALLKAKLDSKK